MDLLLIGGVSGSGKSVALAALEDQGYHAINNLPPSMLVPTLDDLARSGQTRVAIALDVKSGPGLPNLSASNSFYVVLNPPPATAPLIRGINVVSDIVTITWSAVPGHTYRLQYNNLTNLVSWSNLAPDILAVDSTASNTNAADCAQRIYRVELVR